MSIGKQFYQMDNIGTARYTVNFHDGKQKHNDGSPFFGIKTFSNKRKVNAFIKSLKNDGYQPR